jgi:hypothetical protein
MKAIYSNNIIIDDNLVICLYDSANNHTGQCIDQPDMDIRLYEILLQKNKIRSRIRLFLLRSNTTI